MKKEDILTNLRMKMSSSQKGEGLEELIANKRIRLRHLQEALEKAEKAGKISLAIKILGMARREVEGPSTRRRKKASPGLHG